jgi:hypothetical protein
MLKSNLIISLLIRKLFEYLSIALGMGADTGHVAKARAVWAYSPAAGNAHNLLFMHVVISYCSDNSNNGNDQTDIY